MNDRQRKPLGTMFLCELSLDLGGTQLVGETPLGRREIIEVTGGRASGPLLTADVLPGGGDWMVGRPGGIDELDVRLTLRADDGELIYLRYRGIVQSCAVADEGPVPQIVDSIHITPIFETASPRYAWLNRIVGIGVGTFGDDWVSYSIYAVSKPR